MSRNKHYKNRIDLCVTDEQRKYIEKEAKKRNMTMSEYVRHLINMQLM